MDMIDELLERHTTGNVFPEKNPVVGATIELSDMGRTEHQPVSFGVQKEYILRLQVGVNFIANDVQLEKKQKQAERQLKYELYKDIIGDIHEALNVCGDVQTQKILSRMLAKIGIY
ncbi:MAG: hypothetical protein GY750_03770 [Lentisphaerae bacterium]|nr:hypothetical protein [Lentisphaerota bacterium]